MRDLAVFFFVRFDEPVRRIVFCMVRPIDPPGGGSVCSLVPIGGDDFAGSPRLPAIAAFATGSLPLTAGLDVRANWDRMLDIDVDCGLALRGFDPVHPMRLTSLRALGVGIAALCVFEFRASSGPHGAHPFRILPLLRDESMASTSFAIADAIVREAIAASAGHDRVWFAGRRSRTAAVMSLLHANERVGAAFGDSCPLAHRFSQACPTMLVHLGSSGPFHRPRGDPYRIALVRAALSGRLMGEFGARAAMHLDAAPRILRAAERIRRSPVDGDWLGESFRDDGWRHASMLLGTCFGFVAGWMSAWAGAARGVDGKRLPSGGNGSERAR